MTLAENIQNDVREADLRAGVSVWHIESDTRLDVNGDEPFPMASVFKIPILAVACQQISQGRIDLNARIDLEDVHKSLGSGILPYFESGLQPILRDLLTLMIIISDNTATDMVIDLLGGPQAIEDAMRQLGLTDIYFKWNCKQLLRHLFPPEVADLPREELIAWTTRHDVQRDGLAFSKGPDNNVSSANDMNRLLHLIYSGQLFDDETRQTALGILHKQQFNVRLSRFLPLGVKVAHKTGTIGGIRNDSGIIYISDSSHVILTLFTEWDEAAYWNRPAAYHQRVFEVETAMGKIGRAVYDAFG